MGRGKNWKDDEVVALVNSVEPRYSELFGKFDNKITHEHKENLWSIITEEINAIGQENRKVDQVKEKFKKLRQDVKAKVAAMIREQNKTGGGQSREITMTQVENLMADRCYLWEKKIVRLYGIEAVVGIKGGIDSSSKGKKSPSNQNKCNISAAASTSNSRESFDDSSDEDSMQIFKTSVNSNLTSSSVSQDIENQPLAKGSSQIPSSSLSFLHSQINEGFSSQSNQPSQSPLNQDDSLSGHETSSNTTTGTSHLTHIESGNCDSTKVAMEKVDNSHSAKYKKKSDVATEVGETMIDIQRKILANTESIANSLAEFVKIQKLQANMNPDEPVSPQVTPASEGSQFEIIIDDSQN